MMNPRSDYMLKIYKTSAPSNLRQERPRMRALSYACSLQVTWQRWRHTFDPP